MNNNTFAGTEPHLKYRWRIGCRAYENNVSSEMLDVIANEYCSAVMPKIDNGSDIITNETN